MRCHAVDKWGRRCLDEADAHPVVVEGVGYPLCDGHWIVTPHQLISPRDLSRKAARRRATIDPTRPRPRPWREREDKTSAA